MVFVLILHIVWGNTISTTVRVAEYGSQKTCTDAGGQAVKDTTHWKRNAEIDYLCVAVPVLLPIAAGGSECASYVCPSCAPGHIIAEPDVVDVKTAPGVRIKP